MRPLLTLSGWKEPTTVAFLPARAALRAAPSGLSPKSSPRHTAPSGGPATGSHSAPSRGAVPDSRV